MLAKRIIPCLDIRDGQTVKGINFENIKSVGDPVELGALYAQQGADELVFLDITASHEKRKTLVELVQRIALHINIPFTVGGGVSELGDADVLLAAGADKLSINSAAVRNPELISQISENFGQQFVVVAIDAKFENGKWTVYVNGGRIPTDKELFSWAKEAESRGAGEILFTSMNHDGVKKGFACHALSVLSDSLQIPVIASGGAGSMEDFREVFTSGKADAGLAASIFHYKEIGISDLKNYLRNEGISVRTVNN
jgi:imidazole glycerol-phosphate synthase subunit HisF